MKTAKMVGYVLYRVAMGVAGVSYLIDAWNLGMNDIPIPTTTQIVCAALAGLALIVGVGPQLKREQ